MRSYKILFFTGVLFCFIVYTLPAQDCVPVSVMEQIFTEIKTPYKYGLVLVPEDKGKMVDSPSIFRYQNKWYMTYIVFDGRGYETWLAESANLLQWKTLGRTLSYTENTWDANQKAGYIALQDHSWGGSYKIKKFKGRYWMSYLGGATQGYEAGMLGTGIACSGKPAMAGEWERLTQPVLLPTDTDAQWYDNKVIYKSTVIHDRDKTVGFPFIMFYNAKGGNRENAEAERIAMAVSSDMIHWKRYGEEPVIDHHSGISGDAFVTRINHVWVMFYFGAFWKPGAFDRFACSYDLVNWTVWEGDDLVAPTEPFDGLYAHKPYVVKHGGVVYHFYCAVNKNGDRGIAVATSVDKGKSTLHFPQN